MRPLFLVILTFFSACRCAPAPEARLFTQFREAPSGRVLPPEAEAAARSACPEVREAALSEAQGQLGLVTLRGEGLAQVETVAALVDGRLFGEAIVHHEPDGALRFAVGCPECELVLGVRHPVGLVGCQGPGLSLTRSGGQLR
ncbi:hypothetical protein L6R46_29630 [Myxococcota bacterium]|nr:hypothetical protein [Myxococcota bacterium]